MVNITRDVTVRVTDKRAIETAEKLKEILGWEPGGKMRRAEVLGHTITSITFEHMTVQQKALDEIIKWAEEVPFCVNITY